MADLASTSDKVHSALADIISEERAAIVTRWVTLVEVIDEDGERTLWSLSSDGLSLWDQIGMVEFHSRTLQPEVRRQDDE